MYEHGYAIAQLRCLVLRYDEEEAWNSEKWVFNQFKALKGEISVESANECIRISSICLLHSILHQICQGPRIPSKTPHSILRSNLNFSTLVMSYTPIASSFLVLNLSAKGNSTRPFFNKSAPLHPESPHNKSGYCQVILRLIPQRALAQNDIDAKTAYPCWRP